MLILASQSPRRRELLDNAGITYLVRAPMVDEAPLPGEPPENYVRRLARAKAFAAADPEHTTLGADTIVACAGELLGKPVDAADAKRMLRLLSGRPHQVLTGVCLVYGSREQTNHAITTVWFDPLTEAEIAVYIASGEPMDKAGAYAIQGLASRFISRIDGSYSNVVGLPVWLVWRMLRSFPS